VIFLRRKNTVSGFRQHPNVLEFHHETKNQRPDGIRNQAELKLAEMHEHKDGRELVKRIRIALLEQGRPLLEESVEKILGIKVKNLHTDISTVTGERIILFTLVAAPGIYQNRS
jgi:hypothetical protein